MPPTKRGAQQANRLKAALSHSTIVVEAGVLSKRADLVEDALTTAITLRGGFAGKVIFHTDRGTQYASEQLLRRYKRSATMSRTTQNTKTERRRR